MARKNNLVFPFRSYINALYFFFQGILEIRQILAVPKPVEIDGIPE